MTDCTTQVRTSVLTAAEGGISGSVDAVHFENAAVASAAFSLHLRAPEILADMSQACIGFINFDLCREFY